jgi:hypothetical protein
MWRLVRILPSEAMRVVGGDEKGTRCLGVQLGHPVTGDIRIYRDLVLQVGGRSGWRRIAAEGAESHESDVATTDTEERNGEATLGYSGRRALRREQCNADDLVL